MAHNMLYKQNSMGSIDMSNDDGDAGHVPFSNRRMIRYGSMSGGLSGGSTGSSGNHHHALGGEESIEHSEHSRPPSAARTTHINMEGLTHAYKSLRRDHRRGSTVGRVYSRAQSSRASSSNASSQANKGLPPAWLPYVPLFLGAGCVVLASATELVLRKTVTTHLYNYRWFFFELMAILTTLISLGGMMLQAWVKNQPLSFTQLPLKALLAMGFLDTLHSLGMTIGIGILPRTFSILLPQALIPLVVLLRSLKSCPDALPAAAASCSTPRVVGCGTVVLGLFVAAVPHFILFEPCVSEGRSAGEIGWNSVLVLLSLLPAALSSVYRSTLLATYQVDLFHMNACGAALQACFGVLLGPLALHLQFAGASFTTYTGHIVAPPSVSLRTNFVNGLKCLAGIDSDFYFDNCEQYGAAVLISELLVYVLACAGLQVALHYVMAHSEREAVVHYSLLGGLALAYLFFQIPFTANSLLQISDWCLSREVLVGAFMVVGGLVLCQQQEVEESDTVDIWNQFLPE